MSVPNVDTFEHDIAEEIRTKEATLTDIASAGGDLGNLPTSHVQTSRLLLIMGGIFVLAVIGAFVAFFVLSSGPTQPNGNLNNQAELPDVSNRLLALSPTIHDALGGNLGKVTKSEYGYTLEIVEYTPVFAYMIKNEQLYADELAIAVGSPRTAGTTTIPFTFTDITISNQNMRVGTSGDARVVYAFVNAKALVIASSTEGILALRGGILTK